MTPPLYFSSIDYARVEGHGDRAVILCDRDRPEGVGGLVGQTVAIDGAACIVLKIDGRDPSKPVRRGETVALWVTAKAGR